MLRYSLVLLVGLWATGPAAAASWADALFDELSKDFGSVPRGPTLTHTFRVTNNTRGAVNIADVRVSCGCVSAVALRRSLNPGESTSVVASMDTSRFLGVRTVTIYVQFDRPAFEEVRLWVQANARNDFAVNPDTLTFGQIKRGGSPSASVSLTFYGTSDAQVLDARAESHYILPSVKEVRRLDSEVTYQVTARLRQDTPVGRWYTDVWLRTNNPNMPQVRVPLTVEIESALSISPEAVALGQLRVRGESERRVIVKGVRPFKITGIQGTDQALSVRDLTPEGKAVHVLAVKFRPGRPGDLARTVRVVTDLPGDNKIDFQVSAVVTP